MNQYTGFLIPMLLGRKLVPLAHAFFIHLTNTGRKSAIIIKIIYYQEFESIYLKSYIHSLLCTNYLLPIVGEARQ